MVSEQLIIDGIECDMPKDSVRLSMQSNIIGNVDELSTSYSYTITLPRSLTNDRIFNEGWNISEINQTFYRWFSCRLIVGGCPVVDGKLSVSEVNEDGYDCNIFWQLEVLQTISEDGLMLWELYPTGFSDHRDDYLLLKNTIADGDAMQQSPHPLPDVRTKFNNPLWMDVTDWAQSYGFIGYYGGISAEDSATSYRPMVLPCVSANYILNLIYEQYGLKVNFVPTYASDMVKNLVIALQSRLLSRNGGFSIANTAWTLSVSGTPPKYEWILSANTHGLIHSAVVSGENRWLVGSACYLRNLHLRITCSSERFNCWLNSPDGSTLRTETATFDGTNWVVDITISEVEITARQCLDWRLESDVQPGDTSFLSNVSVWDYHFDIEPKDDITIDSAYPIVMNLPDMSVMEFIGELCAITATAPLRMNGNTLECYSIGQLLANKKELHVVGLERYDVQSNWAQFNNLRWATDDSQPNDYDDNLLVDDKTIALKGDWFESHFALPTQGSTIYQYEVEHLWNDLKVEEVELTERMALLTTDANASLTGSGLEWSTLLNNYAPLQQAILHQKRIVAYAKITPSEYKDFDLAAAYYIEQYGAYFAVLNIDSDEGDIYEVELIKL